MISCTILIKLSDSLQSHGLNASSSETTSPPLIHSDDKPAPVPAADQPLPHSLEHTLPPVHYEDDTGVSSEYPSERASSPKPISLNAPSQENKFDVDAIISQEPVEGAYVEYESDEDGLSDSTLSDEQAEVIERVRRRENVFITGPAGTSYQLLFQQTSYLS
jgi:hypothetical protein